MFYQSGCLTNPALLQIKNIFLMQMHTHTHQFFSDCPTDLKNMLSLNWKDSRALNTLKDMKVVCMHYKAHSLGSPMKCQGLCRSKEKINSWKFIWDVEGEFGEGKNWTSGTFMPFEVNLESRRAGNGAGKNLGGGD